MLPGFLRARLPAFKCPVCQQTWFREVPVGYLPAALYDDPPPFQLQYPVSIFVCLCGYPVPPPLDSNQRRVRTSAGQLLNCLDSRDEYLKTAVPLDCLPGMVERTALPALQARVQQLESAIAQVRDQHERAERRAEARGREWLVSELEKKSQACEATRLTYREARAAVQAIFEAIQEGLRTDPMVAEPRVETPIGVFYLKARTLSYDRERWGRKQSLHDQRLHVVFEAAPDLFDGKTRVSRKDQYVIQPK